MHFFLIANPCPVLGHGPSSRSGPGQKLVQVLGPGVGPIIFIVPVFLVSALVSVPVPV